MDLGFFFLSSSIGLIEVSKSPIESINNQRLEKATTTDLNGQQEEQGLEELLR